LTKQSAVRPCVGELGALRLELGDTLTKLRVCGGSAGSRSIAHCRRLLKLTAPCLQASDFLLKMLARCTRVSRSGVRQLCSVFKLRAPHTKTLHFIARNSSSAHVELELSAA